VSRNLLADLPAASKEVELRAWIYGPGLPASALVIESERFARVDRQVEHFVGGAAASKLETEGWTTHEWLRFLDRMPAGLEVQRFTDLDAAFGFTVSGNSEILDAWFVRTIQVGYQPAEAAIEKFLLRVGRRKFLTPIYRALAATPEGRERARAIYARARPGYHAVSRGTLDRLLDWQEAAKR
jgi:hypothetical protein